MCAPPSLGDAETRPSGGQAGLYDDTSTPEKPGIAVILALPHRLGREPHIHAGAMNHHDLATSQAAAGGRSLRVLSCTKLTVNPSEMARL